jgi:hypothetical protein
MDRNNFTEDRFRQSILTPLFEEGAWGDHNVITLEVPLWMSRKIDSFVYTVNDLYHFTADYWIKYRPVPGLEEWRSRQ